MLFYYEVIRALEGKKGRMELVAVRLRISHNIDHLDYRG
jgi:hypothetical protein